MPDVRHFLGFVCVCALTAPRVAGCSETGGTGGSGGSGGTDLCALVRCSDDNPCTDDDCDPSDPHLCVFVNQPESTACFPSFCEDRYCAATAGFCDAEGVCVSCFSDSECTEVEFRPSEANRCVHSPVPAGTPCGDNRGACDGMGTCVICEGGTECTEVRYDPETAMCLSSNRPWGEPCECGPVRCKLCDGSGHCICTEDEQCEAECVLGQTCSQATSLCEGGELVPIDTPCGYESVCDGAGNCVECTADDQCEKDFNECTDDGCDLETGTCNGHAPVSDGTPCSGGTCQGGACALSGSVLPCTEQGIRNAIAAGGGPYTFDCDGPQTVVTEDTIYIEDPVILDGEGKLTIDGNRLHRVLMVWAGPVELRGIRVTGASGAALTNDGVLALMNSTVSHNHGLGIWNTVIGRLTVVNSTVSENSQGGIRNNYWVTIRDSSISDNQGHGIEALMGPLVVTESSISGNQGDGVFCGGRFTITNSTVSTNLGNGISHNGPATTNYLTNSTLSGNQQRGIVISDGLLTVANSLIDGDCVGGNYLSSEGYNIESPGNSCGFGEDSDQTGVTADELKLQALSDNGGPTRTHAVLPGSVAIDQVPEAACVNPYGDPITEDQRGIDRPQNSLCDIGAFELEN